ncbi:MAG: catalase, partial [Acidobacteriota bacterium]
LRDMDMQWDFWSQSPESLHQVTILFSDRGLPRSYRHMHGFGSHTYSLIDEAGNRTWCKFHFKTLQGIDNMTGEESTALIGSDRESHQRDLFQSIEQGDFPRWRFCIQVMTEAQAAEFEYNPFDLTKVWPHGRFPLIEVGILELNRNPQNYFAEVEQASFSPSATVPGISWSPDKMLQARLMSYADAHRYRIGTNFQQLPVNRPRCPVMHFQRDGMMSVGQGEAAPNYFPNTVPGTPRESPEFREPALPLGEVAADRYDHRIGNDDYTQAGNLFRLFDEGQRDRLAKAIAAPLSQARPEVQNLQLCHFFRADPEYGMRVAAELGMSTADLAVMMPTALGAVRTPELVEVG